MRLVILCTTLAVLAGCGADGEPVQPSVNAGVSITPDGVYPSVGVGLSQGPVSIFLGL